MKPYTWSDGATAVCASAAVGWEGIWSLLFAAAKAAYRLSLVASLEVGPGLAFAAMDVCEARDEIAWAHPDVPSTAIAVDLGPLGSPVPRYEASEAILLLLRAAAERVAALEDSADTADANLLARVRGRIQAATGTFGGARR